MSKSKRNFAPVPLSVLAADATADQKLYIAAHYHFDWDGEKTWPSQATLAAIMGVSIKTVQRIQAFWEAKGWIRVQRRPNEQSIYHLSVPDMGLDEFKKVIKEKSQALGGNDKLSLPEKELNTDLSLPEATQVSHEQEPSQQEPLRPKDHKTKRPLEERTQPKKIPGGVEIPQGSPFPLDSHTSPFLQGPWNGEYQLLYGEDYDFSWERDGEAYLKLQKCKTPYEDICFALRNMFGDKWWRGETGDFKGRIMLKHFEKNFRSKLPNKKKKEAPTSDALKRINEAMAKITEGEANAQLR